MEQQTKFRSTALYPADRAWDRAGKGSPHVGVLVGGPEARAKHIEYTFVFYIMQGLGSALAVWWMLTRGSTWIEWSAFAWGYLMINFGVGVGYHRYFCHGSFKTSKWMRTILAITGQMASMGSIINWVADHRRHHAFANVPGDPYGPKVDGYGRPQSGFKSWWMCHLGWLHDNTTTDLKVYGKGLVDDPLMLFCHRWRYELCILSIVVLPGLWGYAWGGWDHVIGTILIGGSLRCFIFSNGVAFNNSIAHTFGYRHFDESSNATSNWFSALLTFGDGWHNAHHAAARIASNKVKWWEFDFNGSTIHAMEALGLAWDVQRRPKTASPNLLRHMRHLVVAGPARLEVPLPASGPGSGSIMFGKDAPVDPHVVAPEEVGTEKDKVEG
ncbi:MAG: acyl-CoA desaturase [Novosphingobium sp.]